MNLDNISISGKLTILTLGDIFLTTVFCESPLKTLKNLLATSKLKFTTTNGLNNMRLTGILGADTDKDLSNINTGGNTNRLSVRVTHTTTQTISTGTRKHLIRTDNMVGVNTDTNVVSFLTNVLCKVLVNGNTACLESLTGNLLLLVTNQVSHKGEKINGSSLGTNVVDLNLTVGYTTAITRLDVRLVLLVAVAAEWTATHGLRYW
mmetsp:Transcript_12673/g.16543  ORF Transcript_12673/g.16543 Transcript_12673/m.16543 type:complete len:206 (-) Transcript_12673:391-1008(-)